MDLLFSEARSQNWDLVKKLIENGADINGKDDKGRTVLEYACAESNIDLVRYLLQAGADINLLSSPATTRGVILAFRKEDVELAKKFAASRNLEACKDGLDYSEIDESVVRGNINEVKIYSLFYPIKDWLNYEKKSLLHLAVTHGQIDMGRFLVECGLDLFQADSFGHTPIHAALNQGYWLVTNLAQKSSGLNLRQLDDLCRQKNKRYSTLLHSAVCSGDFQIVKYLVEEMGYDINIKDSLGETPFFQVGQSANLDIARYLLKKGTDINARSDTGSTSLSILVQCIDLKDQLYKTGHVFRFGKPIFVNDDLKEQSERKELHEKVAPWVTMLHFFLENGADVNLADSSGYSPLTFAVKLGLRDVVQILISAGADVNQKIKKDNLSLIYLTIHNSRPDLCELLLECGCKPEDRIMVPTAEDTYMQYYEYTKACESVFNVPHYTKRIEQTLGKDNKQTETVIDMEQERKERQELYEQYKARNTKHEYYSILHEAVTMIKLDIVKLLVKYGADIDCRSNWGRTPLHHAAKGCFVRPTEWELYLSYDEKKELIQYLVNQGADINAQDENGATPLRLAFDTDNMVPFQKLLELGADKDIPDREGKTVSALQEQEQAEEASDTSNPDETPDSAE